jgi:hypothetical protein
MSSHELPSIDEDLMGSIEEIRKRAKDYFGTAIRILLSQKGDQQFGRKLYSRAYELNFKARVMWATEIVNIGKENCDVNDYKKAEWIIWETKINKYVEVSVPTHPNNRSHLVDLCGREISQWPPSVGDIQEFENNISEIQIQAFRKALEKFPTPDGNNMTFEELNEKYTTFRPEADH